MEAGVAVEFEPVWNYPPGYVPTYADRPAEPRLPRRYDIESDAERALEQLLSPYFTLHRQVRLAEPDHPNQKIDYVAVFKDADAQSSLRLIGIEVKRGFDRVAEACAVIKQVLRYRKAKLSDPRGALAPFLFTQLPYIAIFPRFDWCQGTEWCNGRPNADVLRAEYVARCAGESRALYLLLQHFNVGYIELCPWWSWSEQEWQTGLRLMVGQQQVWTSRYIDQISDGFRGGLPNIQNSRRGMRFLD
jgi:hypothetical protein